MPVQIITPLLWPEDLPHTPRGKQSMLHGFPPSLTIEDALRFLDDETYPFKPLDVQLTTHIEQFSSPRLRKLENISPAISVLMKFEKTKYLLACDRWLMPQHNIYGIVMTLKQIRALDGYGVLSGDSLMKNFEYGIRAETAKSQPRAEASGHDDSLESWRVFLGLGHSATIADANAVYRARARVIGENDPAALAALNDAIDKARRNLTDEL